MPDALGDSSSAFGRFDQMLLIADSGERALLRPTFHPGLSGEPLDEPLHINIRLDLPAEAVGSPSLPLCLPKGV